MVQRFTPEVGNEIERLSGIEMDMLPLADLEKALPGGFMENLTPDEPFEIRDAGRSPGGMRFFTI